MIIHKPIPEKYAKNVEAIRDHLNETGNYRQAFECHGCDNIIDDTILKFYVDRWNREAKKQKEQEEFFYVSCRAFSSEENFIVETIGGKYYLENKIHDCKFFVMPSTDEKHAKTQVRFFDDYPYILFLTKKRYKTYEEAKAQADKYNTKSRQARQNYKTKFENELNEQDQKTAKREFLEQAKLGELKLIERPDWRKSQVVYLMWVHRYKREFLLDEYGNRTQEFFRAINKYFEEFKKWYNEKDIERKRANMEYVIEVLECFGCNVYHTHFANGEVCCKTPAGQKFIFYINSGTIKYSMGLYEGINDLVLLVAGEKQMPTFNKVS